MPKQELTSTLVACLMALALVAAGCGGDDDAASETETAAETPAEEWADGVCTALTAWTADLTRPLSRSVTCPRSPETASSRQQTT